VCEIIPAKEKGEGLWRKQEIDEGYESSLLVPEGSTSCGADDFCSATCDLISGV
jgi:hypothetical protein